MTSDTEQETAADETFDVIVIGGGPVGENVADRAGRTGLSVALVEAELVGGECSYWACIPSKTLLRPGAVRAEARGVPGADVADGLDVPAILARRDTMVADWDDAGQVSWVEGAGITLVRGLGRVVGPRLREVRPEDAHTEPWAGEAVAASLRDLGVDVRLGVTTESVEPLPDGGARLTLGAARSRGDDDAPDLSPVSAARVLVATGRVPRTHDLGVDAVGLAPGRALTVDDTMLVQGLAEDAGTGWLYAAGDVTGRVATTHQGKYQGRVVGDV